MSQNVPKIAVLTSKPREWLLRGFFHQFEKYGGGLLHAGSVEVVGFGDSHPDFIPSDVAYYRVGRQEDYPARKWSDALINYLHSIDDPVVGIMLEDYWLMRNINIPVLLTCWQYMLEHDDVLRFDLTSDRVYGKNKIVEIGSVDSTDLLLCEPGSEYNVSLQAAFWNRERILEVLLPNETPWEFELLGTDRLLKPEFDKHKVIGTHQWPVRYSGVMVRGQFSLDGSWQFPPRQFTPADVQELYDAGCCRES